jgi:putative aldouronate transport system permease protein
MRNNISVKKIMEYKYFYFMLIPALIFYLTFSYFPMSGIVLAFKKFQYGEFNIVWDIFKIWSFPNLGFENFELVFSNKKFLRVLYNTVFISVGRLIFEFPAPIVLALLLNEVRQKHLKRIFQTVFTFPHFLSWVIVVTVLNGILRGDGMINKLITAMGGTAINFLTDKKIFVPLLFITSIWKEAGWGTIIYLASMASISPELYEAAVVDGANRWQCIRYITWPGIKSTVVLLLIISCSGILNAGFDQIFNMYNNVVMPVADIIDTYIYRTTFTQGTNYSLNTAIGLFKSGIGFILLISVNKIAKWMGEEGLF